MQVEDDVALLNLMLEDFERYGAGHEATARWFEYSKKSLEFLRNYGLHNFRSQRYDASHPGAILASFGAVDFNPSSELISPTEMYHAAASTFRGRNAADLFDLPASKIGAPEGFEIDGRFFTLSWLNFYCRYAYVSKFFDFKDQIVVEVGSGSGKQAEMLKRAHPDLTIVLFDLPTQLYVAHQYLSRVFEGTGEVVSYKSTRTMENFSDIVPKKINILPHWKYPIVANRRFHLLWNAASFQEMAPETAKAYLSGAGNAQCMFLMHNIKYKGSSVRPGARGVIDPKKIKSHLEVDRVAAKLAYTPTQWLYFDSFWRKRRSVFPFW
jgi:putative sugar O-methyltransferase